MQTSIVECSNTLLDYSPASVGAAASAAAALVLFFDGDVHPTNDILFLSRFRLSTLPLFSLSALFSYVYTYVLDIGNTSHTSEEGAHSPSWPSRLNIIIIIIC
jgi:hypothetical protein